MNEIVRWVIVGTIVALFAGLVLGYILEEWVPRWRDRQNRIALGHWLAGHAAASPPRGEGSERNYSGDRGSPTPLD